MMMVQYVVISAIVLSVNLSAFTAACYPFDSPAFDKLKQLNIFRSKSLGEIKLEKNVWEVTPLKQDAASSKSKVTIATTEKRYTLACVPTEEGRQQCAELAKAVNRESLHYVELRKNGMLLGSFCTSDLDDIPNHVQPVCDYHECTDETCTAFFVFDLKVALESTPNVDDICKTVSITPTEEGPRVLRESNCETPSYQPTVSVLQYCKDKGGKVTSASERLWSKNKDLKSLCTAVENKHP